MKLEIVLTSNARLDLVVIKKISLSIFWKYLWGSTYRDFISLNNIRSKDKGTCSCFNSFISNSFMISKKYQYYNRKIYNDRDLNSIFKYLDFFLSLLCQIQHIIFSLAKI